MYASLFVSYDTKSSMFEYGGLENNIGMHSFGSYDTRYICMAWGTLFLLSYRYRTISPLTP